MKHSLANAYRAVLNLIVSSTIRDPPRVCVSGPAGGPAFWRASCAVINLGRGDGGAAIVS